MTYQFDPRPEGLHYEPFKAASLSKTMWLLRDGAPQPWVDLRSVCEALSTSWFTTWRRHFEARYKLWRLEACVDIKRRETYLVQMSLITTVLTDMAEELARLHHYTKADRAYGLRLAMSMKAMDMQAAAAPRVAASEPKPVAVAGKKITPYIVEQVLKLKRKGHSNPKIGAALGIEAYVVSRIFHGRRHMNAECQAVYDAFQKASAP